MKNSTHQRLVMPYHFSWKCVIPLVVSIFAIADWALASDPPSGLHVENGRLTGQLMGVPLRAVLGQLHNQLGIDYVVPESELRKVISVTLHKEPVASALSKILAPWDHALIVNGAGNIKTLYLTAKGSTEPPLENPTGKAERAKTEKRNLHAFGTEKGSDYRPDKLVEDQLTRKPPFPGQPTGEKTETGGNEIASFGYFMEIRPPAPGTAMPILPANRKSMPIIPGVNSARSMEIIPSTAYPPMTIQPVSEHMQREMLQSLHP